MRVNFLRQRYFHQWSAKVGFIYKDDRKFAIPRNIGYSAQQQFNLFRHAGKEVAMDAQWIAKNDSYVAKIGEGGYGEVHKVCIRCAASSDFWQLRRGRTEESISGDLDNVLPSYFARKLLRPFGGLSQKEIQNEIQAMDSLCRGSHDNIIAIYQHGQLHPPQAFYFIDMEFCDINLEEYIHSKKTGIHGLLEWDKAVEQGGVPFLICGIMQQVLCGLKFIHDHNHVHRDLNPQNGNPHHCALTYI